MPSGAGAGRFPSARFLSENADLSQAECFAEASLFE